MPRSIYEDIYKDLKMKIEDNTFAYQELLPSENTLIRTYGCSRNTLRRAVSLLVSDGYVQTMQGTLIDILLSCFSSLFIVYKIPPDF